MKSGRWAFRFKCLVDDANQIRKLRRQAIEESTRIVEDMPEGGFTRPVKANKEIALARLIREYAIGKGMIESNPFDRISHNKVVEEAKRDVTHDEPEIVVATEGGTIRIPKTKMGCKPKLATH